MSTDPYSPEVRALFAETAHCGDLPGGIAAAADAPGIRVSLAARTAGDKIVEIRFRAFGCPHFIAACEHFCGTFEGRGAGELEEFSVADIMRHLSVPVEKTGRILVLQDAVRSLGESIGGGRATQTS